LQGVKQEMVEMAEIQIPNLTETQKVNIEILKNITSLNTALNDVQHDTTENRNEINELKKILVEGNGELPIREQVRNHAAFIGEIKYWVKLIVVLFITQFVAFTTASVIAYMKFLPALEAISKNP